MKVKKRLAAFMLSLLMIFSSINVFAIRHEKRDIPLNGIIVNDHIVYSDVHPYIKNNRTYVPIRFIAEELGYDVKWNGNERKVSMADGSTTVELKIGSSTMNVSGKSINLDAPAEIRDDRTFVPLRAIAEAFGERVDYSNDYKAVYIGESPKYNEFYNIVYYYEGADPVISTYTINITTYKMNVNGNVKNYESVGNLIDIVYEDFYQYKEDGKTEFGIKEYSKNTKDEKETAPSTDVLVGTWRGHNTYSEYGEIYKTNNYLTIESLGDNKYKVTDRFILSDDSGSEFTTEAYGYYDSDKNALVVNKSHSTYDKKGFFIGRSPYSKYGEFYLDNSNIRLSLDESNSENYFEK